MRNLLILLYIILAYGCSPSAPKPADSPQAPTTRPEGPPVQAPTSTPADKEFFWSNCAFFNQAELDELDTLKEQLIQSNDKVIFDKYLKLLTLTTKSDAQIQNCEPGSEEQTKRLMKHFVFLGLAYGQGEFSFVNNPRLSSLFEMDYFYFIRDFLKKTYSGDYSEADKIVARYMLGALIIMQASVKIQTRVEDSKALISEIAQGFNILKYGRTKVFTRLIFDLGEKLKDKMEGLLFGTAFAESFAALKNQNIAAKTYPMFLKQDHPSWPVDYSEVLGAGAGAGAVLAVKKQADTVFGIGSGGTALGTGFFAKSANKIIFMTSGHWKYNRQIMIMQQKDAEPFGSAPSQLIWLPQKLDLFNFSEELIVPTLKALDFNDAQIAQIKAKIGDNPFSSPFTIAQRYMPWLDTALAIPSAALLAQAELKVEDIKELKALEPKENIAYFAYTFGFGITEDLASGDISRDKSPGLRRFNQGQISFEVPTSGGQRQFLRRTIFATPITFSQLKYNPDLLSVFSMRFDQRCSGAPFFANEGIVGILQGPIDREDTYAGLRMAEITPQSLALINALLTDPRGLLGIPESDLTQAVRTHVFAQESERRAMHEMLKDAYLQ